MHSAPWISVHETPNHPCFARHGHCIYAFQEKNARSHTARLLIIIITTHFLQQNNVRLTTWPAPSKDGCSLVRNSWGGVTSVIRCALGVNRHVGPAVFRMLDCHLRHLPCVIWCALGVSHHVVFRMLDCYPRDLVCTRGEPSCRPCRLQNAGPGRGERHVYQSAHETSYRPCFASTDTTRSGRITTRPHTPRRTAHFLQQNHVTAPSPDLNPEQLNRKVKHVCPHPATACQLHQAVQQAWADIPYTTVNYLVHSVDHRNGSHTRYRL